jgi:phage-related protein
VYKTTFYTPLNKISPAKAFLDKSAESIRAKILRQLQYVQEFGLTGAVPNLKKLTNTPLWELRILGKDNIRVFCVPLPNKEVVVLHIFTKKKQKTPQNEIAIALKRYQEMMHRH